jgi:DNA-binding NtrC family response regulator
MPEAAQRSLLVVEADPELQTQVARALRRRGHRVVATGSGHGALALIGEWEVDLVLVSETLPGRSGIDLVREIHRVRPGTRVVIVTGHPEPRFAAMARAAGAAGCVPKPLRVEHLSPWLDGAEHGAHEQQDDAEAGQANLPPLSWGHARVRQISNSALPARGAMAE